MLFIMFATATAERYSDLYHVVKNMRIPEGIKIREKMDIFGKPDLVIVFDAKNEKIASEFVKQFGRVSEVSTHLAVDIR